MPDPLALSANTRHRGARRARRTRATRAAGRGPRAVGRLDGLPAGRRPIVRVSTARPMEVAVSRGSRRTSASASRDPAWRTSCRTSSTSSARSLPLATPDARDYARSGRSRWELEGANRGRADSPSRPSWPAPVSSIIDGHPASPGADHPSRSDARDRGRPLSSRVSGIVSWRSRNRAPMNPTDRASGPRLLAELKARCGDLARVRDRLRPRATYEATRRQVDTYFSVQRGRLKLREVAGRPAELIYYERSDLATVKPSQVYLASTEDPF